MKKKPLFGLGIHFCCFVSQRRLCLEFVENTSRETTVPGAVKFPRLSIIPGPSRLDQLASDEYL